MIMLMMMMVMKAQDLMIINLEGNENDDDGKYT